MTPMTRSLSPRGTPTGEVAAYRRRRTAQSVGLIITEGTGLRRAAKASDEVGNACHHCVRCGTSSGKGYGA
ncbi:hypothetical protein GCT19_13855 [Paraburkholderia sp. CNPSo 3155]|nr:hypothetical protein [Paraburkholderia atlantica]